MATASRSASRSSFVETSDPAEVHETAQPDNQANSERRAGVETDGSIPSQAIVAQASSHSVAENWSCSRGHIMHDIYIAYKTINAQLSFEIACRLELTPTANRTKKIAVHHYTLCCSRGTTVMKEAITESLPRCKMFVILVCKTMLEGFKTANEVKSLPLLELQRAIELDGRPMIMPVFIDTDPVHILTEINDYPNEPHCDTEFCTKRLNIQYIVKTLCDKSGYFYTGGPKADVEGLVAKIAANLTSLEQKDMRWKWLEERTPPLYDVFISYRVSSEKLFARQLFHVLSGQRQRIQGLDRGLQVYLDQVRLVNGENWETGFLSGLRNSDVVIFLVSEESVVGIKEAQKKPDSYLLEMEVAFDILDHRQKQGIIIQPVFIGGKIPNPADFPDEFHCHPSSPKMTTISNIIRRLVHLQGLRAFISKDEFGELGACEAIVPQIVERLKEKWERQHQKAMKILLERLED
ncbi:hypothetical protein HDU82_003866 [Entophlyctis luteolus]|nr:hypothetical protein HDU82_003866 [Entophlyctis luteolus]